MFWNEAQIEIDNGKKITSPRLGPDAYVSLSENPTPDNRLTLFSPDGELSGWRPSLSDQMSDTWEVLE